jgi:predicted Zn-dependent protease
VRDTTNSAKSNLLATINSNKRHQSRLTILQPSIDSNFAVLAKCYDIAMKKSLFILLCAFPLLSQADGLPDLGDVSQSSISPQQERQIGEQSMFQIRASKQYLDDAEIADYLNALGSRLVANSSEPSQPFEFFAINDNAINAFAMPGGFVGVNSGLLLTAQNESELASVLSHEIAHVTQHHLARMVAGQKYDSLAAVAAIAVAILAARDNPQAAMGAIAGVQGGAMQRQLNFTRTHEEEADRIGLGVLEKSGFDVRAMPAFFERMQRATRILEGNAPTYLRTHPITAERIADVDNRVQQLPFRLVADSLDFQLVRAKLNATQKTPEEAIAFFNAALGEQKFGNQIAQRYGLIIALMRDKQDKKAAQEFAVLQKSAPINAMITTLAGQLKQKNPSNSLNAFYHEASRAFPRYRALIYDYVEVLLDERDFNQALKLLSGRINDYPNDPRLYELQARTYDGLNRPQEAHHALAYNYILHGNLYGAIDQLELAKAAGDNYYELSTIETELKQFRAIAGSMNKKNKGNNS